jgi:hypothetical protein
MPRTRSFTASPQKRPCTRPLVRVAIKPDFGCWEAVLFRIWQDRLVLLVPEELEIGAVLAIELPVTSGQHGIVVVGAVTRVALGEKKAWVVSCTLRRPLPEELVGNTPTLFAMLCESGELDS